MADQFAQDRNMVLDSRAEFEAWADSRKPRSLRSSVTDDYNYPLGNLAFEVWQAATQRQQERIAALEADIAHKDAYAEQLGRELAKADAERRALEAQVQALSLDAGRYRWLRQEHERIDPLCHLTWKKSMDRKGNEWVNTANLDATIDAAIAAGKGEA